MASGTETIFFPHKGACGRLCFLLVLLASLAGCAHVFIYEADSLVHPLSGQIWDVRARRFLADAELVERLARADFVLLGETHDNPEHHRVQQRLLEAIVARGKKPVLAFEPFDRERQPAISAALKDAPSAEQIEAAAQPEKGWKWEWYEALVNSALRLGLPVVALNLSRADARRVAAEGFAVLGTDAESRYAIGAVWNPERQKMLHKQLADSHCGHIDDQRAGQMSLAQRARDAVMADILLASGSDGAVAILGRGHARRDLAVPLYLARRDPRRSVASVGIVEVETGKREAAAYAPDPANPAYDYIWFTPKASRPDPCAMFAKRG